MKPVSFMLNCSSHLVHFNILSDNRCRQLFTFVFVDRKQHQAAGVSGVVATQKL